MLPTVDKHQGKDTGLAIVLILLLIALSTRNFVFLTPAVIILVLAMACPGIFKPAARVWFWFSNLLGEIVSKILLAIVFFLIVSPVALLRRMSGKDAMRLKAWKSGQASAFTDRNHKFTAADLEKPF